MKRFTLYGFSICIACALLVTNAYAETQPIYQIAPDPSFGCLKSVNGNSLVGKGKYGRNTSPSFKKVRRSLRNRFKRLKRSIEALEGQSSIKLKRLRRKLRSVRQTRKGVIACQRNATGVLEATPFSFKFYCLHGFHVPATSTLDLDCGLNLSALEGTPLDSVLRILAVLDHALVEACALEGGTFLSATPALNEPPLYYGYCQLPGRAFPLIRDDLTVALGMEGEFTDEEEEIDPPEEDEEVDDSGGSDGGDSDDTPKNPPDDCVILQMEAEFTDCE